MVERRSGNFEYQTDRPETTPFPQGRRQALASARSRKRGKTVVSRVSVVSLEHFRQGVGHEDRDESSPGGETSRSGGVPPPRVLRGLPAESERLLRGDLSRDGAIG